MNLTTLTDADLDLHRIAVITEQERRARLKAIPAQVTALATQFITAGGLQTTLNTAILPV